MFSQGMDADIVSLCEAEKYIHVHTNAAKIYASEYVFNKSCISSKRTIFCKSFVCV